MRTEFETTVERAGEQARRAAAGAGVDVRLLDQPDHFRRATEVFESVWGTGPANSQMPAELIRALTHSGSYAAGAFVGDELTGAVVGFLGENGNGVYLHSHILGVFPGRQTKSVGYALKQHQRAWALRHGIDRITWTFDPLVRRNAHFNFQKLGVDAASYLVNFYGSMTDGINGGDESDRLLVTWDLRSARIVSAADARLSDPDVEALVAQGADTVLRADERGGPHASSSRAATLVCFVPEDIVGMRAADPELCRQWRVGLRETLLPALEGGYRIVGFVRSGWYVLGRDDVAY